MRSLCGTVDVKFAQVWLRLGARYPRRHSTSSITPAVPNHHRFWQTRSANYSVIPGCARHCSLDMNEASGGGLRAIKRLKTGPLKRFVSHQLQHLLDHQRTTSLTLLTCSSHTSSADPKTCTYSVYTPQPTMSISKQNQSKSTMKTVHHASDSRAPRGKTETQHWTCCRCSYSVGMLTRTTVSCLSCSHAKCGYCPVYGRRN